MKPEEAIRELREMQEGIKYHGLKGQHYWFRWIHSQGKDIFITAIQALEKQITKPPIEKLEGKEEVIHYYDNFGGIITELETGEKHFNNPSIEEIIAKVNEIIDRVNEGGGK